MQTTAYGREALAAELETLAWRVTLPTDEQIGWLDVSRRLRVAADQAERLAAETGDGR